MKTHDQNQIILLNLRSSNHLGETQEVASVTVSVPVPDTEYFPCYDAHFHPDRRSARRSKFWAGEPLSPGRMPDHRILLAGGEGHEFL